MSGTPRGVSLALAGSSPAPQDDDALSAGTKIDQREQREEQQQGDQVENEEAGEDAGEEAGEDEDGAKDRGKAEDESEDEDEAYRVRRLREDANKYPIHSVKAWLPFLVLNRSHVTGPQAALLAPTPQMQLQL
mmetsp:Transcript_67223/g.153986  ORF Transcript_67223/g.153986 Transcript_67223/m.153986 type:complete len:133 (+) Transcript_67223:28-426(+)